MRVAERTKVISTRVPESVADYLEAIAKRDKVTVAAVVRQILCMWYEAQGLGEMTFVVGGEERLEGAGGSVIKAIEEIWTKLRELEERVRRLERSKYYKEVGEGDIDEIIAKVAGDK